MTSPALAIATAASAGYFTGLVNLVGSVHTWRRGTTIRVYDLGMEPRQLDQVRSWENTILSNAIIDGDWPTHCKLAALYAWKPLAILDALEHDERVVWSDAGSDFRAPLDPIENAIVEGGCFLAHGQDSDMVKLAHPQSLSRLGMNPHDFTGKSHFAGSIQGWLRNSLPSRRILEPVASACLDRDTIAPKGSNRRNHRYDQTLLSLYAYSSGLEIQSGTHLVGSSRDQFEPAPDSPSRRVVFTARCSSAEYLTSVRSRDGAYRYRKLNGTES